MYQIIIVVHVLLGLSVIGFVLIQQGKGADAGAAFGSGSSGSVFGAQGASSFLSRTTAVLATLFFATSLGLAILSGNIEGDIDLMDTPEAEEVFADVPLINDNNSGPVVNDSESMSVLNDEVPVSIMEETIEGTLKDTSEFLETIKEESQVVVETLENKVQEAEIIEDSNLLSPETAIENNQ